MKSSSVYSPIELLDIMKQVGLLLRKAEAEQSTRSLLHPLHEDGGTRKQKKDSQVMTHQDEMLAPQQRITLARLKKGLLSQWWLQD